MFKRVKMLAFEVKNIYTKPSIPPIDLQCTAYLFQRRMNLKNTLS